MGLPLLLLVDDSDVVLAYETSVLSSHYALATAGNGLEAFEKTEALRPAAILLDLSMPVMTGDEMFDKLLASPELRSIPVIVISSEQERGEACRGKGAAAFLRKPIKAEELRATVAEVLAEAQHRRLAGGLRVVMLEAGSAEVGVVLENVELVLLQPALRPVELGPGYLTGMADVYGEPVCVLDLPRRLGIEHSLPLIERKLVLVRSGEARLALCVDRVHDPVEYSADQVVPRDRLAGASHEPLQSTVAAVVRTPDGHRLVIDPAGLLSRPLIQQLAAAVRRASAATVEDAAS